MITRIKRWMYYRHVLSDLVNDQMDMGYRVGPGSYENFRKQARKEAGEIYGDNARH